MDTQKRLTQIVLALVAIILLVAFSTAKAEEYYHYKVYGQNKRTGLTVAGHMWESDKNGNVKAKVYDEFTIQDQCNGTWVGHGVAEVGCGNGYQYVLMVVEK